MGIAGATGTEGQSWKLILCHPERSDPRERSRRILYSRETLHFASVILSQATAGSAVEEPALSERSESNGTAIAPHTSQPAIFALQYPQ